MTAPRPAPTADTWVSKDPDGSLRSIRVSHMEDGHVVRWIRYFREKYRRLLLDRRGLTLSSIHTLDAVVRASIITGPAIYDAARERGLLLPDGSLTEVVGDLAVQARLDAALAEAGQVVRPLRKGRKRRTAEPHGYRPIQFSEDE